MPAESSTSRRCGEPCQLACFHWTHVPTLGIIDNDDRRPRGNQGKSEREARDLRQSACPAPDGELLAVSRGFQEIERDAEGSTAGRPRSASCFGSEGQEADDPPRDSNAEAGVVYSGGRPGDSEVECGA